VCCTSSSVHRKHTVTISCVSEIRKKHDGATLTTVAEIQLDHLLNTIKEVDNED